MVFKDLIKEIERLERGGQTASVPIESDENGFVDKQCPSEDCEFLFKVNEDDWSDIFKDEAVWCPLCRHEAPADDWFTKEQVKHAETEAVVMVNARINSALRSGARKFNRRQPRNSFITMSMKVKGGRSRNFTVPLVAAEAMQLQIKCEECDARFAVIGSAYFCPACGYNSVVRTYSDSLRKIQSKCDSLEIIRQALSDSTSKDEAELICRSLLETCILDGVVAFQKYCEGLYSPYGAAPLNAFQRLSQGSELWNKAIQKGYCTWLSTRESGRLNVLYNKRHILAHNEGIVDERYIKQSGDTTYKEGQRIVINTRDIDELLTCLNKLGDGLIEACRSETT